MSLLLFVAEAGDGTMTSKFPTISQAHMHIYIFKDLFKTKTEKLSFCSFILQMATMVIVGQAANKNLELLPCRQWNTSTWTIWCCISRYISRELDWNWISYGLNWPLYRMPVLQVQLNPLYHKANPAKCIFADDAFVETYASSKEQSNIHTGSCSQCGCFPFTL